MENDSVLDPDSVYAPDPDSDSDPDFVLDPDSDSVPVPDSDSVPDSDTGSVPGPDSRLRVRLRTLARFLRSSALDSSDSLADEESESSRPSISSRLLLRAVTYI